MDHSTIFVFIAASYTPMSLIRLHGTLAWVILGLAWCGAGIGVALSTGWIDASRCSYYVVLVGWMLPSAA